MKYMNETNKKEIEWNFEIIKKLNTKLNENILLFIDNYSNDDNYHIYLVV